MGTEGACLLKPHFALMLGAANSHKGRFISSGVWQWPPRCPGPAASVLSFMREQMQLVEFVLSSRELIFVSMLTVGLPLYPVQSRRHEHILGLG